MPVTLAEMLEREFGVKTTERINPLVDVVGNSLVRILPNNPNRLASIIVNLGANDLFYGFDVETSNVRGILLANGGGGINMKWDSEFYLLEKHVYAIAPGGNTAVYCVEIVTVAFEPHPFAAEARGLG